MRTRRPTTVLLASLALLGSGQAAAHCFMVFDPQQRLVYQSTEAPFDLSEPLSQGLAKHFPRHHLVMTDSAADCTPVDARARAALPLPPAEGSATAARQRLPARRNAPAAAR